MVPNDFRSYKIRIYGRVEEEEIVPTSPVQFTVDAVEEAGTSISFQADQSGMIGLVRHLHGLGLVLVSMSCSIENLHQRTIRRE